MKHAHTSDGARSTMTVNGSPADGSDSVESPARGPWSLTVAPVVGIVDELVVPAAATITELRPEDLPVPTLQLESIPGPSPHKTRWGRKGFYRSVWPGAPTTTRQAEVLNPAVIGSPTDEDGVVIGQDVMSGSMVAHDPITAYPARITSPNVVVIGMLGSGKSSLLKTVYVVRPLLLRDRRAVVIDKKLRGSEGEYAEATRYFGAEPFRFDPDDSSRATTCMNILDPIILAGGGPAAQLQLLAAFASLAGAGQELDEWEHKVLAVAHSQTLAKFAGAGRVPVVPDLVAAFDTVVNAAEFGRMRQSTLDRLDEAAWSMKFRFERLLADDLRGMFDGETSTHVGLQSKLTTFDISALPEDGPATSMVMLVANAWLTGLLSRQRAQFRTNFVVEEGWHLMTGPAGKVVRAKAKLSRALGLSIVTAIHHISDIPAGSDAAAMIKEAQTIHLYRQEHSDDIGDCVRYFNLEASNEDALANLPQGHHLLKIAQQKEIQVRHVRTPVEEQFTETDAALMRLTEGAA